MNIFEGGLFEDERKRRRPAGYIPLFDDALLARSWQRSVPSRVAPCLASGTLWRCQATTLAGCWPAGLASE
jgi:hypothetical protein